MLFLVNKVLKEYKPLVVRMNAWGNTSKKSRKYASKNIGCNILVVG
jgi:hypothetical protein